jgi:hypothetical protein
VHLIPLNVSAELKVVGSSQGLPLVYTVQSRDLNAMNTVIIYDISLSGFLLDNLDEVHSLYDQTDANEIRSANRCVIQVRMMFCDRANIQP